MAYQEPQQFQQTSPQQPSASALLQRGGATASLYGPSLSRSRPSDQAAIVTAQAQYDAQLAQLEAEAEARARGEAAQAWEQGQQRQNRGGERQQAFYNTEEGDALIRQARADLSASGSPVGAGRSRQSGQLRSPQAAAASSSASASVLSSVQDNLQRVHHADCVLPQNIALGIPDSGAVKFSPYPLPEYNRFNAATRTYSGPDTHFDARLKPAAFKARTKPLDVARRHDLVKSLKANQSTNNHDHSRPFVAKHTNNLFSC
jgi:hypothetical protein